MAIFENEICPVCNIKFSADDDIVVCPHCGTPHHRECYSSIGHCINKDKHETDFEYIAKKEANEATNDIGQEISTSESGEYFFIPPANIDSSEEANHCVQCGEEIEKGAPFCDKCGAKQPNTDFGKSVSFEIQTPFSPSFKTKYDKSDETINGKSVGDIARVIGKKADKFINKFRNMPSFTFNWSGFFFGPYYLMYRKLYKQGALTLGIRLIIYFFISGLFLEPMSKLTLFVQNNSEAIRTIYTDPSKVDAKLLAEFNELSQMIAPMVLLTILCNALLHIAIAVIADRLYFKRVIEIIDKIDGKIEREKMMPPGMSISVMAEPGMTEKDLRHFYLSRLGGTTIFSPMMAYFIYDLIIRIVNSF